jgi:hypothetical protein
VHDLANLENARKVDLAFVAFSGMKRRAGRSLYILDIIIVPPIALALDLHIIFT